MARRDLVLALGRTVIAAAWADHELSQEEINSLKDLLFHLPEMTEADWQRLCMYLESPVTAEERDELAQQLREAIDSREEQRFAKQALEQVIHADDVVTAEEREALAQIGVAIDSAGVGLIGGLTRLMGHRQASTGTAREAHFQDFLHNRVLYRLRQRLGERVDQLADEPADLRYLAALGGLLAHVAHVDGSVDASEREAIGKALRQHCNLEGDAAELVVEAAAEEPERAGALNRLTRLVYEHVPDYEQRAALLDLLFVVAAADGAVTYDEQEEIRTISAALRLGHQEYIDAKLRIPAELRPADRR